MAPPPTAASPAGPGSSTRLLVLRHGRSEWNAQGRWQGHADVPLDDEGLRQAAAAAEVLGGFDAVWASDLQRATLTAQIIGEILGIGPVQIDPRLRETDVGPWEGLRREEVEAGWPGYLAQQLRPEGFEAYDAAAQRMLDAFVSIAVAHPGGEVLVVSHGGVIRAVRRALGVSDPLLTNLAGGWFVIDHRAQVHAGDLVEPLAVRDAASDVL